MADETASGDKPSVTLLFETVGALDDKLSKRIDDVDEKLSDKIDGVRENLASEIKAVGAAVAKLDTGFHGRVTRLETQVEDLEEGHEDHETRLGTIEQALATARGHLGAWRLVGAGVGGVAIAVGGAFVAHALHL